MKTIETDILIIGAGPVGLFAVFEAGLVKLRCHLIDALPQVGGQCSEIYPKKPIYDIPGYPIIMAGQLIENLMDQIKPFNPGFTLGERVENIKGLGNDFYEVTTNKGTKHRSKVVVIAGGLGSFEPRKPPIQNIEDYEEKGVEYIIKEPEFYRNKKVIIAGGGDSALDWCILLAQIAAHVTLVHRRSTFRGAPDSVEKVKQLTDSGKIDLITQAEVISLSGKDKLKEVGIAVNGGDPITVETDHFVPLFGLMPKLGPIADWGLELEKNAIKVNTLDYSTNRKGIYAIGDVNTYPGKLKLILCGFHEATLMVQSAHHRIFPDKKLVLKYTTVVGVTGFE